jgi:acetyl-CoA acetyltransferase
MKSISEMRSVAIAGIGITKWGFCEDLEYYNFGGEAINKALKDADMGWNDVQAAFCASVYQGTGAGHQVIKEVGLTGIPIVNVENACSSFGSAFRLAFQSVAADIYDIVIAVGFEKMPRGPIPSTAFRRWELELGFNVQPANYANMAVEYMKETGVTIEDFSLVTVKNRKNGVLNPHARFQEGVTLEEVMNSRLIASPLRLLHCCPLGDGASAIILCNVNKLKSKNKVITVAASTLTSGIYGEEYLPADIVGSVKFKRDVNLAELSARQAYEISGCGPENIDIVQAYDTVAPSELWDLEDMGFCKRGEAAQLLRDGAFDLGGRLPVNTDGGLISRGHPLGATTGGQLIEIVLQLREKAGPRQIRNVRVGLAHSMGAGPNSSVTILKR